MFKKIIAAAAASLLSTAASAGYVQYNLDGSADGTLVIRDEDKSVAFFSISTGVAGFTPQDVGDYYHTNYLIETTTSFTGLGPTNIYMRDIWQEDITATMWLMFSEGDAAGTYNYSMRVMTGPGPYFAGPRDYVFPRRDVTYTGTATQVELSPWMVSTIESGQFDIRRDIPYYDPTQVPEPASAALFGIGALGAAALRRRRKPQ